MHIDEFNNSSLVPSLSVTSQKKNKRNFLVLPYGFLPDHTEENFLLTELNTPWSSILACKTYKAPNLAFLGNNKFEKFISLNRFLLKVNWLNLPWNAKISSNSAVHSKVWLKYYSDRNTWAPNISLYFGASKYLDGQTEEL